MLRYTLERSSTSLKGINEAGSMKSVKILAVTENDTKNERPENLLKLNMLALAALASTMFARET